MGRGRARASVPGGRPRAFAARGPGAFVMGRWRAMAGRRAGTFVMGGRRAMAGRGSGSGSGPAVSWGSRPVM